jgi:hypothetical protein
LKEIAVGYHRQPLEELLATVEQKNIPRTNR